MKRTLIVFLSIVTIAIALVVSRVNAQQPPPRVVTISAKRFQFTPNEITLRRGEPVTLRVSAEDRDHGFYQKELNLDLDLTPDHVSEVTLTPETPGRYVVICDQFCGSGHGNMKMVINVE
ncbi:MAG: cupredoxin domain-containing protein [Thermoanaerobaculia bacterium]